MDLQQIKSLVLNTQVPRGVVIFVCKHSNFIPLQYIEWYRTHGIAIEYVEDLVKLLDSSTSLFQSFDDYSNKLYVFSCDSFEPSENDISRLLDTDRSIYIVCQKISEVVREQMAEEVVTIPKLEQWQLEDLAYSMADGADPADIEYILRLCGKDVNRLYNELQKISLFSIEERKSTVKDFIYDGIFNDLTHYSIFDISGCIIKKDLQTLKKIYSEISNIDCDPLGLVGILIKNFRDVISVQCANNPSPESCGLDTKKFWAVKYSCGFYTREQLIRIYEMLTSIDRRLKLGELSTDVILDYIITYILSV